jgi:hypothetical protein
MGTSPVRHKKETVSSTDPRTRSTGADNCLIGLQPSQTDVPLGSGTEAGAVRGALKNVNLNPAQ